MKNTLVIGASENEQRFSNMAVKRLVESHIPVVAIGAKKGKIGDITIETGLVPFENIHTVTLYINPDRQPAYYNYILSLHPKRIIFNPGTENDDLYALAQQNGIEPLEACTLVMIGTGQF